jgi:glycine hydroxymethyltransferase
LVLVDLRPKGISGRKAEKVLTSIGIVVNRNVIPNDPLPPEVSSGIRIGSPAMTTRGMGKNEVRLAVDLMDRAMTHIGQDQVMTEVSDAVGEVCRNYPVYSKLSHP